MGADKILLEVAIEGKGEVMRVSIPKSAAATFASVAGITGVRVEELLHRDDHELGGRLFLRAIDPY